MTPHTHTIFIPTADLDLRSSQRLCLIGKNRHLYKNKKKEDKCVKKFFTFLNNKLKSVYWHFSIQLGYWPRGRVHPCTGYQSITRQHRVTEQPETNKHKLLRGIWRHQLTVMISDCGRKPEDPEGTSAGKPKSRKTLSWDSTQDLLAARQQGYNGCVAFYIVYIIITVHVLNLGVPDGVTHPTRAGWYTKIYWYLNLWLLPTSICLCW